MNKNIKLAVAGAVLALSASASAGIIIPAGEWTMDINGNVNAFANMSKLKGDSTATINGGEVPARQAQEDNVIGINTGLLPAWLGFTGTTRQNDLDVSFTISMQPNVSDNFSHGDAKTPLNRQAFVTFGDKSWGSVKLGKDIGIFASDAILNDMTLLGVGAGAASSGAATTLGGIGFGYIYAGWKGQVSYTTPNFNGFQATVGITNPNQASGATLAAASAIYQERFGLEGKASYAFGADNFSGKLWVSGATYEIQQTATVANSATAADIGATINAGNTGLTGYYYRGDGAGTTVFGGLGATTAGIKRNSDGGYIQATYKLPTNTKLGLAYGQSSLDKAGGEADTLVKENTRITLGLYHPLTKHLNLVAEYNDTSSKNHANVERTSNTGSLGAILFF
jgi:predicted porin